MIPAPTAASLAPIAFPRFTKPLPSIQQEWAFVAPGSTPKIRAAATVRPGARS